MTAGLPYDLTGLVMVGKQNADAIEAWVEQWLKDNPPPPLTPHQIEVLQRHWTPHMLALEDGRQSGPPTTQSGVYRHYDSQGVLLYVGTSGSPDNRDEAHRYKSLWWRFRGRREVEWFIDREAAEDAERKAIRTERPVFNRTHAAPGADERRRQYLVEHG